MTEPVEHPPGTLRFDYQGAVNGTFDATGSYPLPGEDCSSCAFATPSVRGDPLLFLHGWRTRGGLRDQLILSIAYPTATGSYDLETLSDFAYGIPTPGLPEHVFRITSGEVLVGDLGDTALSGEFTAVGIEIEAPHQGGETHEVEITGTFDVPIIPR